MQEAVQAVRQQRPWAQKPLAQSVGRLHSAPVGRLPQLPSTQTLAAGALVVAVAPVRQRVPLQPR